MKNPHFIDKPKILEILDGFGRLVCKNYKDLLEPITTTTSSDGVLMDCTLYILAPEINYEYRAIEIVVLDQNSLDVSFYTLATKKHQSFLVSIQNDLNDLHRILLGISRMNLFKRALESLRIQVELKKEYSKISIEEQIIEGQANIAVLKNGEKISVGWVSKEGEEVLYYTGKGLREIFKPNMTPEEKAKSQLLQKLGEEALINDGYMERRKISDFIRILEV